MKVLASRKSLLALAIDSRPTSPASSRHIGELALQVCFHPEEIGWPAKMIKYA
jgi:hypothetical protein